jgi:hypothetical protein
MIVCPPSKYPDIFLESLFEYGPMAGTDLRAGHENGLRKIRHGDISRVNDREALGCSGGL